MATHLSTMTPGGYQKIKKYTVRKNTYQDQLKHRVATKNTTYQQYWLSCFLNTYAQENSLVFKTFPKREHGRDQPNLVFYRGNVLIYSIIPDHHHFLIIGSLQKRFIL